MASLISGNTQIWFSPKPTVSGVYRYDVAIDGEVVFVGNTYLEADKNPIIDVTDILRNFVDVNKPPFATIGEKSSLVKDIEVTIYIDGEQYKQNTQKFMIYENPFYKSYMSTPILDNFVKQDIGSMPMLQGWNSTTLQGHLIPTYPAVMSSNITFDMVCAYQNMPFINSFSVNYKSGLVDTPEYVQLAGGGVYQYSIPLSWLIREDVCDVKSLDIIAFSPVSSQNRYKYTIANFDNESRFFLKWKDRYGMPQCQPFGGTLKYHEGIEQNKIVNYQNAKKIIDITNAPKWTLNTKWIKQDLYPFYESIFVSPYLLLYDAYEDKMYNVILNTTDYEEKTFKNQNRNLFNLQLEVELDTTEYMIY